VGAGHKRLNRQPNVVKSPLCCCRSELAVSEMSSSVDNINLRLTERESVRSQKRAVAQRLSAAVGDLEKQLQLSSSQHHETEVGAADSGTGGSTGRRGLTLRWNVQELAREMQDDIAELKRVIPDRKRHKEELESETQKLRIKARLHCGRAVHVGVHDVIRGW